MLRSGGKCVILFGLLVPLVQLDLQPRAMYACFAVIVWPLADRCARAAPTTRDRHAEFSSLIMWGCQNLPKRHSQPTQLVHHLLRLHTIRHCSARELQ